MSRLDPLRVKLEAVRPGLEIAPGHGARQVCRTLTQLLDSSGDVDRLLSKLYQEAANLRHEADNETLRQELDVLLAFMHAWQMQGREV